LQGETVYADSRSSLRQASLAQRIEGGLKNRLALDQPFDAEFGIVAAGLG
jgi:hypothetical protein